MTETRRGILIAFEGIDGAGKTTQAMIMAERARLAGLDVVCSKEPTNGQWGQRIREASAAERMSAADELEAFMRDRREHVDGLITPALAKGSVVILDRYFLSSAAYQGSRGFDPLDLLGKNEKAFPIPDAVFLLDASVDVGLERIASRGYPSNPFERRESLEAVRRAFDVLERPYIHRVNAEASIEAVAEKVGRIFYETVLFRHDCFKPYLDRCEPIFCEHRIEGECDYPRRSKSMLERGHE